MSDSLTVPRCMQAHHLRARLAVEPVLFLDLCTPLTLRCRQTLLQQLSTTHRTTSKELTFRVTNLVPNLHLLNRDSTFQDLVVAVGLPQRLSLDSLRLPHPQRRRRRHALSLDLYLTTTGPTSRTETSLLLPWVL